MSATLVNCQNIVQIDESWLTQRIAVVLAELDADAPAVEISIVDDRQIAQLHADYFDNPEPTTVISFPQEKEFGLLGEVIVSVETVARQTTDLGYRLEEGLLYYMIHGLLHLCGYEHVGVPLAVAEQMYAKQEELFELGLITA
ncbi:MAG: rRNA maturation RNase YbeY [Deltaproteobacteria bacterium]|nr:rRNA maturation RNase YbeY [Candidatus Anaeroferrophillus wilburensis]MBN2889875.1 rRNA maturation RNase YbeY [Deltaproteobacteria bacterium]